VLQLLSIADVIDRLIDFLRLDREGLVRAAFRVIGIWLLAWLALRVVRLTAERIEKSVDDGDDSVTTMRERRGRTISQLLRSVGRIVIVTIAVLLTFNVFINIAPILAGAGILGLAVSFGAQSLVRDVIAGFFILSENQFGLGDVIEVAGKAGVVERMTLRVVVLRDLEGAMHIVPNGELKVVTNRTRGWARSVVDVGVPYDVDLDRAIGVIRDEAAQFASDSVWAIQLDGPLEVLGVESLGDSAIVIRTLIKTQPGSQWSAGREFRRRLILRLDREGIQIPLPERRVHLLFEGGADAEALANAVRPGIASR
jgi:moderate conductance mechanosensitive channel